MKWLILIPALALAACSQSPLAMLKSSMPGGQDEPVTAQSPDPDAAADSEQVPTAVTTTVAPVPAAGARTADKFDTTTAQERAAAAAPAEPAGETLLGSTVASLGDPSTPGFWLETPLVSAPAKGRVRYPGSGQSAQVDLIPIEGPATAGSRISLPAMRLIEAPLTDLPQVEVYSGG